jgi:hypothetical protein
MAGWCQTAGWCQAVVVVAKKDPPHLAFRAREGVWWVKWWVGVKQRGGGSNRGGGGGQKCPSVSRFERGRVVGVNGRVVVSYRGDAARKHSSYVSSREEITTRRVKPSSLDGNLDNDTRRVFPPRRSCD